MHFLSPFRFSLLACTAACSLCLGGTARAQLVSMALGLSAGQQRDLHLTAAFELKDALLIGGYGLDARLLTDLGAGSRVELDGLLTLPLNAPLDALTLYGGPGAALDFGPLRFRPSLTLGAQAAQNAQLGLFGEASWLLTGGVRFRAGLTYSF
ncbi:hypothetical protein [Deinococcus sp.]|uniref:hypothetical protein n=1 Tax=Deinococcus sp. TaxID=47478 RepID=UPI003CC5DF13